MGGLLYQVMANRYHFIPSINRIKLGKTKKNIHHRVFCPHRHSVYRNFCISAFSSYVSYKCLCSLIIHSSLLVLETFFYFSAIACVDCFIDLFWGNQYDVQIDIDVVFKLQLFLEFSLLLRNALV